jgi:D-serine deaminase-like pyridoxal phosphate-dependent protein
MAHAFVERNRLWARLKAAVESSAQPLPAPIGVVDVEAFDANGAALVAAANRKPIRLVTRSLGVPELIARALQRDGFRGVLAGSLAEALWLHDERLCDDIVVGYPSVDAAALSQLAASPSAAGAITLMIDSRAHLEVVDSIRASKAVPIRVAIDIDAGLRMGRQHAGVKRSPLYDATQVVALAAEIESRRGFRLVGAMTYAATGGFPDLHLGRQARSMVRRKLESAAQSQLVVRRAEIAQALAAATELEFWNAGGSGSVTEEAADPIVTEVSAGSGLFGPSLIDAVPDSSWGPAAYYGLPVTRRPSPEIATVHGGGFVASGPTTADRLPLPWAPPGLHLTDLEGAGETQTPLTGHPAALLRVGDLVWFRPAKPAEFFDRVNHVHLLHGSAFESAALTYRGLGHVF